MERELILPMINKLNKVPFVILSWAQSLDGFISLKRGQSTAISCPESMKLTHAIRSLSDGILVGIETILADDPSLTCRYFNNQDNPVIRPIILDSRLRIQMDAKVLTKNPIIFTTKDICDVKRQKLLERGCFIEVLESTRNLPIVLNLLKCKYEIDTLMVEGGSQILQSFNDVAHLYIITIAPKIFKTGVSIHSQSKEYLRNMNFKNVTWKQFGTDMILLASN